MAKSKRHHPRLKRKTYRRFKGGAGPIGTPMFDVKGTKCNKPWFGSITPKGCKMTEDVIQSLTKFYNECNKITTIEYTDSKKWLRDMFTKYITGQAPFEDTELQRQIPPQLLIALQQLQSSSTSQLPMTPEQQYQQLLARQAQQQQPSGYGYSSSTGYSSSVDPSYYGSTSASANPYGYGRSY